jgi:outer membrane protein
MGVTTDVDYDVADRGLGPIDGEDDPGEVLVSRALARRPELASLEKAHEADVLTIRSLRGGYWPSISGLAGAGVFGSDLTNLTPGWEIGLTASWPIFSGWLTHGQINEAKGNLGAADAQLEAERLQVRLDVEQARLSLRSAKVSIGATEEALVNAREQLRLAESSYSQGVGNIIQLGDAQVAETAAGAQRVQADFNLAIARAQLLLALGRP